MNARPNLRVVNADGEIVQDDRDILIEQLQAELKGKSLTIGKMKRELRDLRMVEPEAQQIQDVLNYWRERCMPRASICAGGKRWEKVRARFGDRLDNRGPWAPEELKMAVDGALLDPWLNGTAPKSKGYLDAETIYRDSEMVEKLLNLAMGFASNTGVQLGDFLDYIPSLGEIDWKFALRVCMCGHKRIVHSIPDPNREGREGCLSPGCDCWDWDEDPHDLFNQKVDPHLREHYGRWSA